MSLMVAVILLIAGLILIAFGCIILSEAKMYSNIDRLETETADIRDSASEALDFVGGLPIPENTQVRLFFGINKIILVCNKKEIELPYKRINDIYYVENIENCDAEDIACLALFDLQTNKSYLVIEYNFKTGVHPIVFDAMNNPDFCKKIAGGFYRPYLKSCVPKPVQN